MKKKLRLLIFFIVLLIPLNIAVAFDQLPASSPNPVGSGARALGMGGAFIGVADDATAASWNPGGLVQLEKPEFSIVVNGFHRIEDNNFETGPESTVISPESSGKQTVTDLENLNYLSFTQPFVCFNRNMVFSVNYQHLYDFTREWDFPFEEINNRKQDINYQRSGNLSAVGFALGIDSIPWSLWGFTVSGGITFNIWNENLLPHNKWEENIYTSGSGTKYDGKKYSFIEEKKNSYLLKKGYNLNTGILLSKYRIFNPEDILQVGFVFKSPFFNKADLQNELTICQKQIIDGTPHETPCESKSANKELQIPQSYGVGFSYRSSDKCIFALDFYRTEWDDYLIIEENGTKRSPITGKSEGESDIKPTHQIRFGVERLFYDDNQRYEFIIATRGGIFFDPSPAQGYPDSFLGATLGFGFINQIGSLDFALQYRRGIDGGESMFSESYKFSQNVDEWNIYLSTIIYLDELNKVKKRGEP